MGTNKRSREFIYITVYFFAPMPTHELVSGFTANRWISCIWWDIKRCLFRPPYSVRIELTTVYSIFLLSSQPFGLVLCHWFRSFPCCYQCLSLTSVWIPLFLRGSSFYFKQLRIFTVSPRDFSVSSLCSAAVSLVSVSSRFGLFFVASFHL